MAELCCVVERAVSRAGRWCSPPGRPACSTSNRLAAAGLRGVAVWGGISRLSRAAQTALKGKVGGQPD